MMRRAVRQNQQCILFQKFAFGQCLPFLLLTTENDNIDGKTYKVDTFHFFADDVAQHTSIVDGIGQRLTLGLENIRGGGGQRRVTVFCRYWILNVTEHCLKYKQEGSTSYVSGTVLSAEKDGSLPLNGARSQSEYESQMGHSNAHRKIFGGTAGALATIPGRCELPAEYVASLLDSEVNAHEIAKLSFMFNFHEDTVHLGNSKLSVQLYDRTGRTPYVSDWSRGFGLESVGVAQPIR